MAYWAAIGPCAEPILFFGKTVRVTDRHRSVSSTSAAITRLSLSCSRALKAQLFSNNTPVSVLIATMLTLMVRLTSVYFLSLTQFASRRLIYLSIISLTTRYHNHHLSKLTSESQLGLREKHPKNLPSVMSSGAIFYEALAHLWTRKSFVR
jgi:hypothetical protein